MEAGIEKEFSRLESFFASKDRFHAHSAQANIDLKLFLRKHLNIDGDGTAPPTDARPSAPVTLHRLLLQHRHLPEEITSQTPGLYMKEFGNAAVIGWDAATIAAEILRLEDVDRQHKERIEAEERAEREKKEAEARARWERRSEGHSELLAKAQGRRPRPLGLRDLPGSYIVRLDSEEGEPYNDPYHDDDVMKLDVFPSKKSSSQGVKACFSFGMVEGTMLLGMSRRAVELLREEQPKDSSSPESEWESSSNDGDREAGSTVVGRKRKLGSIADPWGVQAARAKRQKLAGRPKAEESKQSRTNRVYFQFVCSEVDGYPLVDDLNKHVGHFDFDETGLTAKGVFHLPCLGKKDEPLSIFKVAEKAESDREPKPWYEYDGRRWGPW